MFPISPHEPLGV